MTLNTLKTLFFVDHVTLFFNRAKQDGGGLDAHISNGFQIRASLFTGKGHVVCGHVY